VGKTLPKVYIIATADDDSILLIKGASTGHADRWYLPKGLVRGDDQKAKKSAQRILRSTTGIRVRVSQLEEIDLGLKEGGAVHCFRARIDEEQIRWLGSQSTPTVAALRKLSQIREYPKEYGCNVIRRLSALRLIPPYRPPQKKVAAPRTYDHYCPGCGRSTTSTQQRDSCGACGGATAP